MSESDLLGEGRVAVPDIEESFHRERAKIAKAPATEESDLSITLEGFSGEFDFEVPRFNWTPGSRLPTFEDPCLAVFDNNGDCWVPTGSWQEEGGVTQDELTDALDAHILQRVTSLPSSPFNGQEVIYVADATNGVEWHLRYDSDLSGSYKWAFIGGSSLTAYIPTYEEKSVGALGDLTTVGPSITLPLAGDYDVLMQWNAYQASSLAAMAETSLTDGSNNLLPNDFYLQATIISVATAGTPCRGAGHGTTRVTGRAAQSSLKLRYSATTNPVTFRERRLSVIPVRVG